MSYTRNTFVIYDKQFQTGIVESLVQNINVFNAASAGAIELQSASIKGDYERYAYMDALGDDADERRDPNSLDPVGSKDLTQSELVYVVLNRRQGPVKKTLDAWANIDQDAGALSIKVGNMFGEIKSRRLVNSALLSLVSALGGQNNLIFNATALGSGETKTLTTQHLVSGIKLLGDAYANLACLVMHSKPFFDLVGNQIADKMEKIAGAILYGGSPATFSKPVIVTDSPSLLLESSGQDTKYFVLGLQRGACIVKDDNQGAVAYEVPTGTDTLAGVIQSEYRYLLGMKGMAWDTSHGGANPTDAALGTPTNWDKVVTSDKDLPGFLIAVN